MADSITSSQEQQVNNRQEFQIDLNEDIIHLSPRRLDDAFTSSSGLTNSMERHLPEQAVADQQEPKKMILQQQDDEEFDLSGYMKIDLPFAPLQKDKSNNPVFRRSLSDSYASPASSSSCSGLGFQSPPEKKPSSSSAGKMSGSSSRPPPFRRSVSDISPLPVKSLSGSFISDEMPLVKNESSDFKPKLMTLMAGMKRLEELCDELFQFDGEASKMNNDLKAMQEDPEKEFEENVFVDRTKKGCLIRFQCPCNRGYRVILSGKYLFYKLTTE